MSRYGSVLKAKSSDYVQVSPWESLRRSNAATVRSIASEFGMSPSSRTRISVTPPTKVDPFDRFLMGKAK